MNNFDSPKNSIKEEQLGYSYLAYYLAKIIKDIKPKNNAYVIGICGKWGDGKTSLNYIKEILCYSYQNNCNLDINNYKNILGEIKSNKSPKLTQNYDKEKILNKLAIFNTLISFSLVIVTLLIKFNIKVIKNRLESYIKISIKIINDLENLHIDKDINYLIEFKNKYTELYNDLLSSF